MFPIHIKEKKGGFDPSRRTDEVVPCVILDYKNHMVTMDDTVRLTYSLSLFIFL